LRDLFGYWWAFRCSTGVSSDTILGPGWANQGYTATEIEPRPAASAGSAPKTAFPPRQSRPPHQHHRPRRLGQPSPRHHADQHQQPDKTVIPLHGKDDAA
jgi:hypothetical protein